MHELNKKLKLQHKQVNCLDYIIISSIDWAEIWQMPQQLADSLVKSGHKVLFIENTGVRSPRFSDAPRIISRIKNWVRATHGFFNVQDNLTVYSPLFIPLPYSRVAQFLNRFLLSSAIQKWMIVTKFHNPIIITFLPTPLIHGLVKDIDSSLVIYYCANDMSAGSIDAAPLRKYENTFFSNVDAIFCNSNALLNRASTFSNSAFLVPAGVDFEKFELAQKIDQLPEDLIAISGLKVGYVGAVSAVFDQELMAYIAKNLPNVNFIIIGPIYVDVTQLKIFPNIIFFGKRSHSEIPIYIKGFDVALIPYIKNTFTDAVYPCKLNEYLAMGAKVVATNLRELQLFVEQHGNVVQISRNRNEFLENICRAIDDRDKCKQNERINVARANSWECRFEKITDVISKLMMEKSVGLIDWRKRLRARINRSRLKLIKLVFFSIATFLVIFYTPLVWFFGDQLVVRNEPKASDAIVIFSGDGETGYNNQSYQRRTIDAIHYYNSGYASFIVLSSGRDNAFSEVEIIRALLINRGVPMGAIKIIQNYPRSTFENVTMVKKIAIDKEVKSILLITSPYHSRRSLLVWRKWAPDIAIVAPKVVDTPNAEPIWGANLNQIRVILYEYTAIAYYWWKGWL